MLRRILAALVLLGLAAAPALAVTGYEIKQSSTESPLVFLMIDSTDHISAKTGLTATVTISKAGAAFGSPSGAVAEIGSGWYKVAANATDTGTLGPLCLHATATGADPTDACYNVVAYDPQDGVALGLAAVTTRAATAQAGWAPNLIKLDASASTTLHVYEGQSISITSGTGSGQVRIITAYSGATLLATVTPAWVTVPDSTSHFAILPNGEADVESWTLQAMTIGSSPGPLLSGYVGAATSTTFTLALPFSNVANTYARDTVSIVQGTGAGQVRIATASTANGIVTVTPAWTTTPDATSVYAIYSWGVADVETYLNTAVTAVAAGVPDVNVKNYNNQTAQTDAQNLPKVDPEDWKGAVIAAVNVSGVPKVDAVDWLGTAVAAATAGVPDVNVKNVVNVTAVLDSNNRLKVDADDYAGGTIPATAATGVPDTNLIKWRNTQPNTLNSGKVDVADCIHAGTARGGAPYSLILDTGASQIPGIYSGDLVEIISGTGAGQTNKIVTYSGGTVFVAQQWTITPDSTSVFILEPGADILGEAIETTSTNVYTLGQAMRLMLASTTGTSDGGGTSSIHFYAPDGTARISATVDQTSGNRTAITVNPGYLPAR